MRGLARQDILVPAINFALFDPNFKPFTIPIEGWSARPFDGYFHPSTHSTWNVRQLALYLMAPHLLDEERMQVHSVFAITQGHFWHRFLQEILTEAGLLVQDEVPFKDEEHRRTGHMDGLLEINGHREGLEIKTINQYKLPKITSEADLIIQKPGYYAQAQEYLDVFDLPQMRFLFISPSYPFPMKEFVVKANPEHQAHRREIYKAAIQISEATKLPLPEGGCCGQPDTCQMRLACKARG